MKYTILIIAVTIVSCTMDKGTKSSVAKDTVKVTAQAPFTALPTDNDTTQNEEDEKGESDCVFDNDYKGLTFDWLAEVGKPDFVWRKDLQQACIAMGQDTIYASQGGCDHFGILVELRLGDDGHPIEDSTFWIGKALSLASEFDLKQYEQAIKDKKIRKAESSKNVVWFEIDDDDADDNLYYNGVEINFEKKSKVIRLSQYFN